MATDNILIIGITGGIGSGKTAVTELLQQANIAVIDADIIVKQLLTKTFVAELISQKLGSQFVVAGKVAKSLLRDEIFNNKVSKHTLENILHPLVFESVETEISQLATAKHNLCFISAALLLEKQRLLKLCNKIAVVDCSVQQQIQRTIQRDKVSKTQVQQIIDSQISRADRLQQADFVIDNSASKQNLITNSKQFIKQLL